MRVLGGPLSYQLDHNPYYGGWQGSNLRRRRDLRSNSHLHQALYYLFLRLSKSFLVKRKNTFERGEWGRKRAAPFHSQSEGGGSVFRQGARITREGLTTMTR